MKRLARWKPVPVYKWRWVTFGKQSRVISRECRRQVRLVPRDPLIPYIRNSRIHTEAQVALLAASIREFGWTNPILIRPDFVVIAGHARLLVARKLGLTEVPVIELSGLSEVQCRALAIADNQLAINGAGWDEEMLRIELAALQEEDFDLNLVGFDTHELDELLLGDAVEDGEDVVPELPTHAVTVAGDVWLCGPHRVLCGNVTSLEAVAPPGPAQAVRNGHSCSAQGMPCQVKCL